MSDPTIQTFCCRHGNGTDLANAIRLEFNTTIYNGICVCSSLLGVFGAIYQILSRTPARRCSKLISYTEARARKIVVRLALSDLCAAIGVLARSLVWISYRNIMPTVVDNSTLIFCITSSAFIQYFYASTWFWTMFYALDMRLVLRREESNFFIYHLIAWGLPAFLAAIGLFPLYYPNASCHGNVSRYDTLIKILPNYLATYLPIIVVMIVSPYSYWHSVEDLKMVISGTSGQYTEKERRTINTIKLKSLAINTVFYICWLPNLVNGLLVWTLPSGFPPKCLVILWYTMAFSNPLQAFLNCLVYRRWTLGFQCVVFPWRSALRVNQSGVETDLRSSQRVTEDETYPLLMNTLNVT